MLKTINVIVMKMKMYRETMSNLVKWRRNIIEENNGVSQKQLF